MGLNRVPEPLSLGPNSLLVTDPLPHLGVRRSHRRGRTPRVRPHCSVVSSDPHACGGDGIPPHSPGCTRPPEHSGFAASRPMASPRPPPASCSWCLLAKSPWKEQRLWAAQRPGEAGDGAQGAQEQSPGASPRGTGLPGLPLDPRFGAVDWPAPATATWLCPLVRAFEGDGGPVPVSPGSLLVTPCGPSPLVTLCWNGARALIPKW